MTLNNLGCHFKTHENLPTSLFYLEKALKLEKKVKIPDSEMAITLINLTAVLSKLKNHEKAAQYSFEAISLLEKLEEEIPERLSSAYYNYAVELEYSNKLVEAKRFYEKAYELNKNKLGENHESTKNFLNKLIQFNFTHPISLDSTQSRIENPLNTLTVNKSIKKDSLDILLTTYKIMNEIRFKILAINKTFKRSVKVLAFPKNKYPVYRLLIPYENLEKILKLPHSFEGLKGPELSFGMKKISDLLILDKGSLKLGIKPVKTRPFSVDNLFEKQKK